MKRIHYGTLTIDVSDQIADLVSTLAAEAATSYHRRSQRIGNGFTSQAYAIGRTEAVTLRGYVNGATSTSEVQFLVGVSIPLAVQTIERDLADPYDDVSLGRLTAQVGEYLGESGTNDN